MSTDEFKEWFEEFSKARKAGSGCYGGSYGTRPKDIDAWIDQLSKTHNELRSRLGGERRDFSLHLNSVNGELSDCDSIASNAVSNIQYALPGYLTDYGLDRQDLFKEKLTKFKNIKTSKHVMGYVARSKVTEQWRIDYVEKALTALGDARAKTVSDKDVKTNLVISTEPKAYTLIGHFGCDCGSCFAHGNFNDYKRWCFSIMPNTFVLLMKSVNTDTENAFSRDAKDPEKPIFRMLGYTDDDFSIFNVCSVAPQYGTTGTQMGTLKEAAKRVAKKILRAKTVESTSNSVTLAGNVYSHHPSWTFFNSKKHKTTVPRQVLDCKMCDYIK
jgi:hypothetical protein